MTLLASQSDAGFARINQSTEWLNSIPNTRLFLPRIGEIKTPLSISSNAENLGDALTWTWYFCVSSRLLWTSMHRNLQGSGSITASRAFIPK